MHYLNSALRSFTQELFTEYTWLLLAECSSGHFSIVIIVSTGCMPLLSFVYKCFDFLTVHEFVIMHLWCTHTHTHTHTNTHTNTHTHKHAHTHRSWLADGYQRHTFITLLSNHHHHATILTAQER